MKNPFKLISEAYNHYCILVYVKSYLYFQNQMDIVKENRNKLENIK